jgi:hypothetical protein
MSRLVGTFAILVCLVLPQSASAWGPDGHSLVGSIADQLLIPNARQQVKTQLGVDLREAGPWLDCVRSVHRQSDGSLIYVVDPKYEPPSTPFANDRVAMDYASRNWIDCVYPEGTSATGNLGCHNTYHFDDVAVQRDRFDRNYSGTNDHDLVAAINAAIAVLLDRPAPPPFDIKDKREALFMVNGADTFHISPYEIIVGAMPNLGLGQGKYLIDFAREDEQLPNFFDNLSYASGVGHIVPYFGEALRFGLKKLAAQDAARRDAAPGEKQRRFYAGAVLALEGVADHCRAFATLAREMAEASSPGESARRHNLLDISDRTTCVAEYKPATLAEAAQLIFTLHSCLHHAGEPTAVGRLDLLQPFYEADLKAERLDEWRAQEIVDCFWIKIGEKVQLNRQFVEDHQVFENLAMGNSSGSYPQGSSLNQWIPQVTVGDCVADDSPGSGTPAYNDLTQMCLRAARRLPLNAPCLSLRMRPDIPADPMHEAALAILSGGAHPILLSDAKIIPGLQPSGNDIGNGHGTGEATPVAEKAKGRRRSTVSLRDSRDYACDGCYEPQLSGTSWFTLGGLISTQPLEAAQQAQHERRPFETAEAHE